MKKFTLINIVIAIVMLSCQDSSSCDKKIVFMNNNKVFEEFEMKKDYDLKISQDLAEELQNIKAIESEIQKLSSSNKANPEELKLTYLQAQQSYNAKFEELSVKYTSEVNERLNEYIKKFSNENNYDFILGSGGQGNVMFVNDSLNITESLIKYINKCYGQ